MQRRGLGVTSASAWLLLAGCQANSSVRDGLPEPTQVGEHLRFYTDEAHEAVMCGGTLSYMDRYIHELVQIHDASPDLVVDYYWLPEDERRITEICSYGTACTFSDAVTITPVIPHEHELVHAVRGPGGWSQGFLEEGAAEVWGTHGDRSFDYTLPVEPGVALAEDGLPIPYYGVAGRFSSFLLFDFGLEAYLEMGNLAPSGSNPDEVDDAFEAVTGMSLSEVVASYQEAGWRCKRSVYRDDSIACAVAPQLDCSLASEDGTVSVEFELDCSSEHLVGARDGVMWSELVIPLPRDRLVYLSVFGDEDDFSRITLGPCGVGCEDQRFGVIPNVPIEDSAMILYEGPHLFRIEVPADDRPRGTATLTIRNLCEPRM